MKKRKADAPSGQTPQNRNALRAGSYSLIITAIVLAILIAVNVCVSALPSARTRFDISASKLYSITSNTKAVVNALEEDVTIYWIVQSGEEDDVIENLLSKYESLSDHIRVVKRNPDVYPTFAEQYTDEEVPNNSLVVECGDRSRFISYYDIYLQDSSMFSYTYSTSFDGEGAITSAIDYVVNEEFPQLYVLEGHGEAELPATFSEQLEKENIETNTLSLLTVDAVPEDADCLLIYSPASDISETERDLLADYVAGGGKLLVMAGPTQDGTLENLYSLLTDYGVETNEGFVVEEDRAHYTIYPYVLLPEMNSHEITDALIEENYFPILPISTGLTVTGDSGNGTVTQLLTTSDTAFSKVAGYDLTTYEKEEGDIDGPFAAAVAVESSGGGQMVWFSSSHFLDDAYNALSSLIGENEAMAIRSKSLNYNYLTISDSTASLLKTVMIGVCPLLYLGVGIAVILRRRRNRNVPG